MYVDKEPTVFIISDSDQRLLLLANQGTVWRLALGCSQNESELLLLFVDGVVHQADHTGLLGFTWRQTVSVLTRELQRMIGTQRFGSVPHLGGK